MTETFQRPPTYAQLEQVIQELQNQATPTTPVAPFPVGFTWLAPMSSPSTIYVDDSDWIWFNCSKGFSLGKDGSTADWADVKALKLYKFLWAIASMEADSWIQLSSAKTATVDENWEAGVLITPDPRGRFPAIESGGTSALTEIDVGATGGEEVIDKLVKHSHAQDPTTIVWATKDPASSLVQTYSLGVSSAAQEVRPIAAIVDSNKAEVRTANNGTDNPTFVPRFFGLSLWLFSGEKG